MSAGGHRPQRESIAIIGGGIIGLSLAWRLAQAGLSVSVFDKGAAGSEASWAGAGMLAPGGEFEAGSPLLDFSLSSRAEYRSFVEELQENSGTGIDFQENGALELAYSIEEWAMLEGRAAEQARVGIPSKPVESPQATTFWPRIRRESLVGARFYPGDAIVNPRELSAALRLVLQKRGVSLHENAPVEAIRVSKGETELRINGEMLSVTAAVMAAGAWSSSIEIEGVSPLPEAKPIKGHLIGYQQPEQTCATIVRHGDIYILQRANGLLIVGASVEDVGFDRDVDDRIVSWLGEKAGQILPHLAETTPSEAWIGFRPGGPLQIGMWESPRLWLAYGHYRNGILLAPATARKLVHDITANLKTL